MDSYKEIAKKLTQNNYIPKNAQKQKNEKKMTFTSKN